MSIRTVSRAAYRTACTVTRRAARRATRAMFALPDSIVPGNLAYNGRTPASALDFHADTTRVTDEIDRLVWAEHRARHGDRRPGQGAARA